jgi:transposase
METPTIVISAIEDLPQALRIIDDLLRVIGHLQTRIEELEADNKRLRDQLHLNSSNSSLPPSSDKGRGGRATRSLRTPSGRKPGGQDGHPGTTLKPVAQPDHIIVHPVSRCDRCGADLSATPVTRLEKRQVFELPPVRLDVTEHQAEIKPCPCCAHENQGAFPAEVQQPTQYGARMKGLLVYLHHGQLLPYDRTTAVVAELVGQPISQGTLLNATQTCAAQLAAAEDHIKQALRQAPVVQVDETGLDENGRRIWLHSASTPELTYYFPHDKRGQAAMQAAEVLPEFEGIAMHDHWEAYQQFAQCTHAFCHAHHLRELQRAIDQEQAAWAEEMKTLLLVIKEQVDQAKAAGQTALLPDQIAQFQTQYRAIVDQALQPYLTAAAPAADPPARGRQKQSTTKNLLDRFDRYQTETLRFMTDFRVPFDNNLAERDLRMMKVKQKISGTFRSPEGTRAFCRIRGFISTVKKQGKNVLEALTNTFKVIPNTT